VRAHSSRKETTKEITVADRNVGTSGGTLPAHPVVGTAVTIDMTRPEDLISKNVLSDFDIAVAITQAGITAQFETAWRTWMRRKSLDGSIDLMKEQNNLRQFVKSTIGIKAQFGVPKVSLNVPGGTPGQVMVTLTLTTGTISWCELAGTPSGPPRGVEYQAPFSNWSIWFPVELDKEPVSLASLQTIDAAAHDAASGAIAAAKAATPGLSDGVFSIEYLFLKFQEIDAQLLRKENYALPGATPWMEDQALKSINLLLRHELGKFPLGVVVRQNPEQATPTFAMTDFLFHVRGNPEKPQASTLAYLGVFSGRTLPTNQDDARRKLTDNWVPHQRIDGTVASVSGIMALRKGAFLDNYLIQRVAQILGRQPDMLFPHQLALAPHWRFSGTDPQSQDTTKDGIRHVFKADSNWHFVLTVQPGQDCLSLTGRIETRCKYEGFLGGKEPAAWFRYGGHRDVTGSVKLVGSAQGVAFKLKSQIEYQFGDVDINEDSKGGLMLLAEGLGKLAKGLGLIGMTPGECISTVTRELLEQLRNVFEHGINRAALDLSNHAFIPPGGAVFLFANPRFTKNGDLHLDVTYQYP
jgi:hypothetical protein